MGAGHNWFWSTKSAHIGDERTLAEPKRKFRWLLEVDGIPMWTIKKVDKPSITISTSEHVFINHKFYYPGRVEYNEIGFTIVDSCNPDAAQTLRHMLSAGGYRLPWNVRAASQSMSKEAMRNALGTINIKQIAAGGISAGRTTPEGDGEVPIFQDTDTVYEWWRLHNAFVTSLEFGDLDYTSDDLSEINVKMRYDFAILNPRREASQMYGGVDFFNEEGVFSDAYGGGPANWGDEAKRQD